MLFVAVEVEVLESFASLSVASIYHPLQSLCVTLEDCRLAKGIGKAVTLLHEATLGGVVNLVCGLLRDIILDGWGLCSFAVYIVVAF